MQMSFRVVAGDGLKGGTCTFAAIVGHFEAGFPTCVAPRWQAELLPFGLRKKSEMSALLEQATKP
jgi:hypothetical protein